MKLQRVITGIAAALLLTVGIAANPAFADNKYHGKGKVGHYLYKGKNLSHHRGNRSRSHLSRGHGKSYKQKRYYGHKSRGYSGQRSHNKRHLSKRYYSKRHGKHGFYKGGGHHNQFGGNVQYRSNDLVGALIGGAAVYHLGRKLSRH